MGIDSEAHAGAMLAKGRTVAVLGCGLSFDYLKENASLRRAIARHGAVVSEYQPFTSASVRTFPIRNRLISGMTLGTVVVEAGVKSGSLITADRALEQCRDVFAVPGDILRSSFDGTNHLIRNGAKPVFSVTDILEDYEFRYGELIDFGKAVPLANIEYVDYRHSKSGAKGGEKKREASAVPTADKRKSSSKSASADKTEAEKSASSKMPSKASENAYPKKRELDAGVSENAKTVYSVLTAEPMHVDDIVRESGLTMSAVLGSLTELELFGFAELQSGKKYVIC